MSENLDTNKQNRDNLVSLIKADFLGPRTLLNEKLEFHKLDTNEAKFSTKEEMNVLFVDKDTEEEIIQWEVPRLTYSIGMLHPPYELEDIEENPQSVDTEEINKNLLDENPEVETNKLQKFVKGESGDSIEVEANNINRRKPSSMGISYCVKYKKNSDFKIKLKGGLYKPFPVYLLTKESIKNFENIEVPQEEIDMSDMSDMNTWWVNIGSTYKKIKKHKMLWAPSDNNQEHHSNLKLMKPGDVFFGYYNTSIQFIGLVTSDPILNQTNPYINDLSGVDESTSTWATDSERMGTIVNFEIFELFNPIKFTEISEDIRKNNSELQYSIFNKNGITATKYCSKVNEELNDYLIKEFNHRMPLSSPVSVFFNNRDVFTFNPENNLDKDMWQLITSFEGDFNTKELTEMLVENGYDISLENLSLYLDNLATSKELIKTENNFSTKNAYKKDRTWYKREAIEIEHNIDFQIDNNSQPTENVHVKLFEQDNICLELKTYIRKINYKEDLYIATSFVKNISPDNSGYQDERYFFQSELEVSVKKENENLLNYYPEYFDFAENKNVNYEDLNFSLLYQGKRTYAVGHGVSTNWAEPDEEGFVSKVYSENIPIATLNNVTFDVIDPITNNKIDIFMDKLSDENNLNFEDIEKLIDSYEKWIDNQKQLIGKLDKKYQSIASSNIQECENYLSRMKSGTQLLKDDDLIRKAFALMNSAMIQQQNRPDKVRNIFYANSEDDKHPKKNIDPIEEIDKRSSWRPFQIAFILANIDSTINHQSEHRDLVDLIWFPTGGGKTEAYLGLSSLSLFHTRLINPSDDGVGVLMRYTLKLLTAQQFERASRLILSMELLRKKDPELLGKKSFSIGIWVGLTVTPNTHSNKSGSIKDFNEMKNEKKDSNYKFVLTSCPWCKSFIGKLDEKSLEGLTSDQKKNFKIQGIVNNNSKVYLKCSNPNLQECPFTNFLPIYFVDEDIYSEKPSLIVSTVDKFARIVMKPQAKSMFSLDDDTKSPPNLIIQDELHLITQALGSIVGLYETIIERFCSKKVDDFYVGPKIIAATATIKNYKSQINNLYARDSVIFPPQSLDIRDSFFAKEVPDSEGKKYLGLNFQSLSSLMQSQVNLYSILFQSSLVVNKEEIDPWWTNLIFYSSTKELSNSLSLFQEDIPIRLKSVYQRYFIEPEDRIYVKENQYSELTARNSDEFTKALDSLNLKSDDESSLRSVLATSVIEVGIDVPRLSLMSIVGQPKTTSAYIQVSGRVGRDINKPPLIITLFHPLRARDKSHYEKFISYHQQLYSQVEPASVTPFSSASLSRNLLGMFVMYVRALQSNEKNKNFNREFPDDIFESFTILLEERIKNSNNADALEFLYDYLNEIPIRWKEAATHATRWDDEVNLFPEDYPFLTPQGSFQGKNRILSIQVPTSMRNVDDVVGIEI